MELKNSFGFNLGKIVQKMDKVFSETIEQYAIDSRDYGILLTVLNHPSLTQAEIGDRMGIDRTTIGQLIDDLERKALLQRQKNPKDRRQNLLILTTTGEKIAREMWESMHKIEQEIVKNLTKEEEQTILTIAKIIQEDS
ncbi:MarR family winged helix-turn-helix transcriptional regulator [Streptococcus dentiloxodontae]